MAVASSKSEARGLPRITMRFRVCLVMSEDCEIWAVTRDMSDGGLFVLVDSKKMPAMGASVNVQRQDLPNSMEAP